MFSGCPRHCHWHSATRLLTASTQGKWQGGNARLYSRGQRADVFVTTERQADCGKSSALVEHLCYLGGQVAGGSHEHLPEVASPGGGLLLRSARRGQQQTRNAGFIPPRMATSHSHRDNCQPRSLKEKFPMLRRKRGAENNDLLRREGCRLGRARGGGLSGNRSRKSHAPPRRPGEIVASNQAPRL